MCSCCVAICAFGAKTDEIQIKVKQLFTIITQQGECPLNSPPEGKVAKTTFVYCRCGYYNTRLPTHVHLPTSTAHECTTQYMYMYETPLIIGASTSVYGYINEGAGCSRKSMRWLIILKNECAVSLCCTFLNLVWRKITPQNKLTESYITNKRQISQKRWLLSFVLSRTYATPQLELPFHSFSVSVLCW